MEGGQREGPGYSFRATTGGNGSQKVWERTSVRSKHKKELGGGRRKEGGG